MANLTVDSFKNMVNEMQHCIGYKRDSVKRGCYKYYRNYFCGTSNYLDVAVENGLCRIYSTGEYGNNYCVTEKGIEFLQELSKIKIVESR